MTTSRKRSSTQPEEEKELIEASESDQVEQQIVVPEPQPEPDPIQDEQQVQVDTPLVRTGKIFVGEEDKRLFKKYNQQIMKKLGLSKNRSIKM